MRMCMRMRALQHDDRRLAGRLAREVRGQRRVSWLAAPQRNGGRVGAAGGLVGGGVVAARAAG